MLHLIQHVQHRRQFANQVKMLLTNDAVCLCCYHVVISFLQKKNTFDILSR